MGYWDETDQYISRHGRGPECPRCGEEMFPQDDHGRFTCFCNLGGGLDVVNDMQLDTPSIPQADTSNMSDKAKARIAPINRLESEPTAAEANVLSMLLRGPGAMDDPKYIEACRALEEERNKQLPFKCGKVVYLPSRFLKVFVSLYPFNMKVVLRQYKDSDKDAIWQLHVDGLNQTGSFIFNPELDSDFENIKGTYIKNDGDFFVASLENTIIGMGALRKVDFSTAEIKRMRVNIKHQRKGLGSIILKKLIERAKELGYKKLTLDTSEKQNVAKHLYEKYGFRECDRKKFGDHETIFYELEIGEGKTKTLANTDQPIRITLVVGNIVLYSKILLEGVNINQEVKNVHQLTQTSQFVLVK